MPYLHEHNFGFDMIPGVANFGIGAIQKNEQQV